MNSHLDPDGVLRCPFQGAVLLELSIYIDAGYIDADVIWAGIEKDDPSEPYRLSTF
jgi:hypothetical protein